MSHSFTVSLNRSLNIQEVTREAGLPDLQFVAGYSESIGGSWPAGLSYVYRDNLSVRTIEIEQFSSNLNVRIFSASSPDDYDLALRLVCAIAKLQDEKIAPEDNETMSLDEFQTTYGNEWAIRHGKTTLSMLLTDVQEAGTNATITGVHRATKLGPRMLEQILTAGSHGATEFYDCLRTLNFLDKQGIYQPSTTSISNKEGDRHVRVSTYTEDVPSVIVDKNTVVNLVSSANLKDAQTGNPGLLTVPAHKLPGLVGGGAKWLSEDIMFLPGLKGDDWASFIKGAKSYHVQDTYEYGYDPKNDPYTNEENPSDISAISDSEYETLALAPIVVFCFVAASDGNVDRKEIEAFQTEILSGLASNNEVMQNILVATMSKSEELMRQVLHKEIDVVETIRDITSILDAKLSIEEALHCKKTLLKIGLSVAEASGGFLGRFGSKISKEEKHALAALSKLFGVI